MSAEDIFSFRQQYGNRLRQLLQAGAESASSSLHRELLGLIGLWVRPFWHVPALWEDLCIRRGAKASTCTQHDEKLGESSCYLASCSSPGETSAACLRMCTWLSPTLLKSKEQEWCHHLC